MVWGRIQGQFVGRRSWTLKVAAGSTSCLPFSSRTYPSTILRFTLAKELARVQHIEGQGAHGGVSITCFSLLLPGHLVAPPPTHYCVQHVLHLWPWVLKTTGIRTALAVTLYFHTVMRSSVYLALHCEMSFASICTSIK